MTEAIGLGLRPPEFQGLMKVKSTSFPGGVRRHRDFSHGRPTQWQGALWLRSPKGLLNLPSSDTSLHHPWFHWFPDAESQHLQDKIKIKDNTERVY